MRAHPVPRAVLGGLAVALLGVSGCANTAGNSAPASVIAEPAGQMAANAPANVPEPQPRPDDELKFEAFLAVFRDEAIRQGVRPETYDRAIMGLTLDRRVGEQNAAQPEFVRPVWDYLAGAVSDLRVSQGREKLAEQAQLFDRLEPTYGVPRQILTAVWGLESGFGRNIGRFNLFQSLATLAYDGSRQAYGRREFIAALKIADAEKLDPRTMEGSWAGAFGQTQFVPSTFLEHAVDGDGDGNRDLWNNPADALASAASYLKESGWRAGESWGEEVRLPEGFAFDQADETVKKPEREWAMLGVRTATGQDLRDDETPVSIFLPSGARGPAFLIRNNFNAILRYNNATSYALAIGLLADRMRGRDGVIGSWPRDERQLNREERMTLQTGLNALGWDVGMPDGVIGRQTRSALRAYQKMRGLPADGFATASVLTQITAERPAPPAP